MNKNYNNINYTRMGVLMLPTFLRDDELTISFIKAIMAPLDDIHAQFLSIVNGIDYNIYSQVCYMQGLINDNFDPLERRIRIINSNRDENLYLFWKESKDKPVRLTKEGSVKFNPFAFSRNGQIADRNSDFDVVLPKGFTLSDFEKNRMENIINQNKLASKKYTIRNG